MIIIRGRLPAPWDEAIQREVVWDDGEVRGDEYAITALRIANSTTLQNPVYPPGPVDPGGWLASGLGVIELAKDVFAPGVSFEFPDGDVYDPPVIPEDALA